MCLFSLSLITDSFTAHRNDCLRVCQRFYWTSLFSGCVCNFPHGPSQVRLVFSPSPTWCRANSRHSNIVSGRKIRGSKTTILCNFNYLLQTNEARAIKFHGFEWCSSAVKHNKSTKNHEARKTTNSQPYKRPVHSLDVYLLSHKRICAIIWHICIQ